MSYDICPKCKQPTFRCECKTTNPDTRREWVLDRPYFGRHSHTVCAHTKGEARALYKILLKEPRRLPIGYEVKEVST